MNDKNKLSSLRNGYFTISKETHKKFQLQLADTLSDFTKLYIYCLCFKQRKNGLAHFFCTSFIDLFFISLSPFDSNLFIRLSLAAF